MGTTLTRGEMLHLALMSSENRAAHALGRTYPGGLATFVSLMNAKSPHAWHDGYALCGTDWFIKARTKPVHVT